MTKTKKITTSPQDELRMRVIALKSRIEKRFDYTPLYEYVYGPQTKEELNRIRAVWNLREVDEKITANLEKLVKNIQ